MLDIDILGTIGTSPTRNRDLSSVLLNYRGDRILLDCGEGVQKTIMAEKLGLMKIDNIFITHWHADHFSGLLGLVQTMGLEDREKPLRIYGPPRTEEFVEKILSLGYFDRKYDIIAEDIQPGDNLSYSNYKIKPFKTKHRVPSLGYAFEENVKKKASREKMSQLGLEPSPLIGKLKNGKTVEYKGETIKPEQIVKKVPGRKVVYTGDTAYSENTVKQSKNADLLIHEASFTKEIAEEIETHSSAEDAAKVAKKANVKKLLLIHFSRRFSKDPSPLFKEAKEVFDKIELAKENQNIKIKPYRPESSNK